MSKLQYKQQKVKNEDNSKELNINPEKILNKKRRRNYKSKIEDNNNVNKNNKAYFNSNITEEFPNEKRNPKKKGKKEKDKIEMKKIDKLNTKNSSGSNNTSEEKENKIMPNTNNRVYIIAIKSSFTENELRNYFKKCGKIINIHINKYNNNNSSEKGIYIDFENKNAVNKALKKNGEMFKGEKIIIKNYLESDINIEKSQKNIELIFPDVKKYIDNEFIKITNFFEIKFKRTNDKLDEVKNEVDDIKTELNTSKNEIKNLKIALGLTNEIINQNEIYNNGRHEYLNSKINNLINLFKD